MFDQIVGNDPIKKYLSRMVERRAMGNSLLFAGPDGVGKSLFAKAFAHLLIPDARIAKESHPDVRHYRPEGKIGMHTIESMRRFSDEVYLAPLETKWKIFIIHDAERMLSYSANALLKTFEEPAEDSIILLVSSSPHRLLPTVLSRCRTVHFQAIDKDELAAYAQKQWELDPQDAMQLAARSHGSIGAAHRLVAEEGKIRERLFQILSRPKLSYGELTDQIATIAKEIEEGQGMLADAIRAEVKSGFQADMTASQKQALEKEAEGAAALLLVEESREIFETILGWYRDLALLAVGGDSQQLFHRDWEEALQGVFRQSRFCSLETVHAIIDEAKLALQRSTSLSFVLENLFLKLRQRELPL